MDEDKDAIGAFAEWTKNADKLRAWSSNEAGESCYEINYANEIRILRRVDWSAFANLQSNFIQMVLPFYLSFFFSETMVLAVLQ